MKKAHCCVFVSFFYFLPLAAGKIHPSSTHVATTKHSPSYAYPRPSPAIQIASQKQKIVRREVLAAFFAGQPSIYPGKKSSLQRALNILCDGFDMDEVIIQRRKVAALDISLAKLTVAQDTMSSAMDLYCPPPPPPSPSDESDAYISREPSFECLAYTPDPSSSTME